MSHVVHPLSRTESLWFESSLKVLQTSILSRYKAFAQWQQHRKMARELEAMPQAMRKDLGWPAINTSHEMRNARQ